MTIKLSTSGLGIGQTWQAGGMGINTTYTNTLSKPIGLLIYAPAADATLVINGYSVPTQPAGSLCQYIVPAGGTYRANTPLAITSAKLT